MTGAVSTALAPMLAPVAGVPLPGPPLAPPLPWRLRQAGMPRLNLRELVMVATAGEIVPPGACAARAQGPNRGPELPGPGGIVLTQRIGDPCIGLAADRLEPGVMVQSLKRTPWGSPNGLNRALNAYSCIGNRALVLTGPARGQRGVVTGKHGACDHVCVDFPFKVLRRLRIGDRIQIYSLGLGLRLTDHPKLRLHNCSPRLLRGWGLASAPPRLLVPVTHRIPAGVWDAEVFGSGGGGDGWAPGEYAISLSDQALARRLRLDRLRFGDLVAIEHAPDRPRRQPRGGITAIGVLVSGDGPLPEQGPGVLGLIVGASRHLEPVLDARANLATVLALRALPKARARRPLPAMARAGPGGDPWI